MYIIDAEVDLHLEFHSLCHLLHPVPQPTAASEKLLPTALVKQQQQNITVRLDFGLVRADLRLGLEVGPLVLEGLEGSQVAVELEVFLDQLVQLLVLALEVIVGLVLLV